MAGYDAARAHLTRIRADIETIARNIVAARRAIAVAMPGARSTPTDTGGSRSSASPGDAIHQAAEAFGNDAALAAEHDLAVGLAHLLGGWAARPATKHRKERRAYPGLEALAWIHAASAGPIAGATIVERIITAGDALADILDDLHLTRAAWGELAAQLARIERQSQSLAATCTTWAHAAATRSIADMWCQHCDPIGHAPARYRIGKMRVCAWTWAFQRAHGRLPVDSEIDAHYRGERVRVRVVPGPRGVVVA